MIECESIFGNTVSIPKDELSFRISAYAILIDRGRLLVLTIRSVDKYCFPGGGIDLGEKLSDGLRREVLEETGLEIEIGELFHFKEHFFYYDPADVAFQSYMFFFNCTPISTNIILDTEVNDDESEKPRWVNIDDLIVEDFQTPLQKVFKKLLDHRRLQIANE
jgi:8-oxo-dGTP pyrophosphatase MutT (NUDIX family)